MATRCDSFDQAEKAAKDMSRDGNCPAAVTIRSSLGLEFWAVASPDDLDTLEGEVESITLVR